MQLWKNTALTSVAALLGLFLLPLAVAREPAELPEYTELPRTEQTAPVQPAVKAVYDADRTLRVLDGETVREMTLADYLENLTGEHLYKLITDHRSADVQVSIPKFDAQSELELEEPLKDMGITALFNVSTADLRGIGSAPSGNNLYVSSVLHKTYLELDESGTRAAAATVVEAVGDALPSEDVKTVTLDRPFLYMIVDTHACVPLFMGTVTSME